MSAPAVGEVLAGKYRIERVLGEGGMGVVVVARHLVLDELVAIKYLLPQFANNQEVVARFIREAKAAIRIQSEHVVRVSDVAQFDSGAPYMVMELLEGSDLAKLLERQGPLSVDDATSYVLQACEALAQAHELGIIHRDLKPPNLFLTMLRDGTPCLKVLDFGISKFIGSESAVGAAMTKTGGTMGSLLYMPPEQLDSAKHVDARTDIWALGTILYELLAGRPPFTGEHLGQIVRQIMSEQPRSLREARPDVSPELDAVIRRCMEKNREARFASIAELAVALLPFAPRHARTSVERIVRVSRANRQSIEPPVSSTTPKFEARGGGGASAAARDSAQPAAPAASGARTNGNWGKTGGDVRAIDAAGGPKRGRAALVVIGLGALVVLGGGGLGLRAWLRSSSDGPKLQVDDRTKDPPSAPKEPATTEEEAVPTVSTESTAASEPMPAPSPSPTIATTTTTTKAVSTTKPPTTLTPTKPTVTAKPAPSTSTSVKTSPTLDCTPPYTIDADGIKHHKPGCG